MLVLTRNYSEAVAIFDGDDVVAVVTLVDTQLPHSPIRIGFSAESRYKFIRLELLDEKQLEKVRALL